MALDLLRDAPEPWDPPEGALGDVDRSPSAVKVTQRQERCGGSLKAIIVAVDVAVIIAAMAVAFGLSVAMREAHALDAPSDHALLGIISLPLWVAIFFHYHLYSANHVASRRDEIGRLVHAVGAVVVGMAALGFMARLNVARGWLGLVFVTATVFLVAEREVVRRSLTRRRRQGRLVRRVLIIGGNSDGVALCANLVLQKSLGYEVVGFVDDHVTGDDLLAGRPVLGRIDDARQAVRESGAQGVILVASAMDTSVSNRLARDLAEDGVRIELLPSLVGVAPGRLNVRSVGRFPIVDLGPVYHRGWRSVAKRGFDLLIGATVLLVTLPFLGLIALAVFVDSPGPVLFRQKRVGRGAKSFEMLKFRSMDVDAEDRLLELSALNEASGPLFKVAQDPRVTRVGRFLRRHSLDELPQCWNVIKGDMAIVGPRPALPGEVPGWTPELHGRLKVKPGITGLWQIGGRSEASFADYANLDLFYVDNWSLMTDLSIVVRTIPAILSRRGAY